MIVDRVVRRSNARCDRRAGLDHQALLAVLGVELVDDPGALDRDAGFGGQAHGKGLVGLGEAPRMAPLDGAQEPHHLVGDDDGDVHHGALSAGDHLGPLLGGQVEIVVVRRRDASLGSGPGAGAHIAETVVLLARQSGFGAVGLIAGDRLDGTRRLHADQHVAVLHLEPLGEAPRDVGQRAFGGVRPRAADRRPSPGGAARHPRRRQRRGNDLRVDDRLPTTAQTPCASTSSPSCSAVPVAARSSIMPMLSPPARGAGRASRLRAARPAAAGRVVSGSGATNRARGWRSTRAAMASEASAREPRTAVRTPLTS